MEKLYTSSPVFQNAEYYMSYEQLNQIFQNIKSSIEDNCEEKEEVKAFWDKNLPIILAALTSKEDNRQKRVYKENLELWENIVRNQSQGTLDHIKVTIQGKVLGAVCTMCIVGFFYEMALFTNVPATPETVIPLAVSGAGAVGSLVAFLQVVNSLEDDDFCVYMQAVTHFRRHKKFTLEELYDWFPHGEKRICNMHTSEWNCDYLDHKTDLCNMLWDEEHGIETKLKVQESVKRLLNDKKLLKRDKIEENYFYSFRF